PRPPQAAPLPPRPASGPPGGPAARGGGGHRPQRPALRTDAEQLRPRRRRPMSHVRTVCLALLASALASAASAQEVEPVRITLRPAPASRPALRYHLLPQLHEMTPGNAADRYRQALAAMKKD